ncbi:MAG: UDP-N-acetylglucosamine 2-epimerase (non-hydrolyzing) [Chloroflexi bacterium]|nr:UDP-N-acetylglucosamine 2-epimerase (non-hydrolyzing) [Chloroflexota bacterium]
MSDRIRVMILLGTRPEAIKLAPVIRRLADTAWVAPTVAVTGQHREMLDQALEVFQIQPDLDLNLMQKTQTLAEITARTLEGLTTVVRQVRPDLLLVQGDTTSAFAGALAAFYEQVCVGHVEAGLRSCARYDPFPEELNRRLITGLAELHFAPTELAARNLRREGVPDERIIVTGNTVVDALLIVNRSPQLAYVPVIPGVETGGRTILVTLHRRENWGTLMAGMCRSLRQVLDLYSDVQLVFPMHRNPMVRSAVFAGLGDHPRAHLIEPLDYLGFVRAMSLCHFIVTDSGGVQEEAPVLGKPVLVLRDTTERPEAIEAGTARLVGAAPEKVLDAVVELLDNQAVHLAMSQATSPFGDGHASERIVEAIGAWGVKTGRLSPSTAVVE